jgi:hypothetical protein
MNRHIFSTASDFVSPWFKTSLRALTRACFQMDRARGRVWHL